VLHSVHLLGGYGLLKDIVCTCLLPDLVDLCGFLAADCNKAQLWRQEAYEPMLASALEICCLGAMLCWRKTAPAAL
jgi:hypothetical protein